MQLHITYKDGTAADVSPDLAALVAAEEAGWTQDRIAATPLTFASFLGHQAAGSTLPEAEWRATVAAIDVLTEPLDPTARED